MARKTRRLALVALAAGLSPRWRRSSAGSASGAPEDFKFGMILVGPQNDHGWSQAHYEAGQYVVEQLGLAEDAMIVLDKVNTADRPDTTIEAVVDDMISQGAQLIFATSDDMRDGIIAAAAAHPDVPMIWASGDSAWAEGQNYQADLTNLGNIMGKIEYGKMIGGCAAALTTQTGRIAYLGPLINDETRRLVNSAYLGARHCWETYRGEDPAVAASSRSSGSASGSTSPGSRSTRRRSPTSSSPAAPTSSSPASTPPRRSSAPARPSRPARTCGPCRSTTAGACDEAPDACLGVPYFNWGPSYLETTQSVIDGNFAADVAVARTGLGGHQQPRHQRRRLAQRAGADGRVGDDARRVHRRPRQRRDQPVHRPAQLPGRHARTSPTARRRPTPQIWYTTQLLEGIEGASAAE